MLARTIQDIHYILRVHLKSGIGPCCMTRSVSFLLQDGCLLSNTHHKRQLKGTCDTGCVWGEREQRQEEERNEMGHEWASPKKKGKKERKCTRGKCTAPPLLQKPRLILCLLIFITIAASCKMFDGFVQILVPLIHNYCYTCRTKGNFRRGAVWKAAARLQGWWGISAGPRSSSEPLGYRSSCRTPAAT